MSSIFRTLVIVCGALMFVPYATPFFYVNTDDSALWNLLQWDGYSATITPDSLIYVIWPIALFGVLIGLYFFWRPARQAFVVFTIASIGLAAFEGVRVAHPLDVVVGSIMHPIYGALIAISYFTSVATRFEPRKIPHAVETK